MPINYNNRKKHTKSFVIWNIFVIFAVSFLFHNMFTWFPNYFMTIFPVNESLYEHLKLIYLSSIVSGFILYIIYFIKNKKINNFYISLFITTLLNILIFYAIFLPIYYRFGENMIVTLSVYFISIIISQIINYYLINREKDNRNLNIIGFILIIITYVLLMYFTYNPIGNDFFIDPKTNEYGFSISKQ